MKTKSKEMTPGYICSCDIEVNPTAINKGNAAYLEMVLNTHVALVEALSATVENNFGTFDELCAHIERHGDNVFPHWKKVKTVIELASRTQAQIEG